MFFPFLFLLATGQRPGVAKSEKERTMWDAKIITAWSNREIPNDTTQITICARLEFTFVGRC